jgi:hypothetical protein
MHAAEREVQRWRRLSAHMGRRTNQALKVVQCDQTSVFRHFYHEGSEEAGNAEKNTGKVEKKIGQIEKVFEK